MPLGQPNDAVAAASASTGRRSAFLPFYLRLHKRSLAQLFNCCRRMNESDVAVVVVVVDSLNEFEFECGPCKRRSPFLPFSFSLSLSQSLKLLHFFLTLLCFTYSLSCSLSTYFSLSCSRYTSLPSSFNIHLSFSLSFSLILSLSLSFSASSLLLHLKVWQSNFAHRSLVLLVVVAQLLLLFLLFSSVVVVLCFVLLLLLSLPRTVSHF